MEYFKHLYSSLTVSWEIETLAEKFTDDIVVDNNKDAPQFKSDGSPHWQYYKPHIRFSRNFYRNFPDESIEVTDKLKLLQNTVRDTYIINNFDTDNILLQRFLIHDFNPMAVTILKINAGVSVVPHIDSSRQSTLNIGLRNSNSCQTIISDITDVKNLSDFNQRVQGSYIMNDGDVYLLSTMHGHAVKSLSNINDRYLITYPLL